MQTFTLVELSVQGIHSESFLTESGMSTAHKAMPRAVWQSLPLWGDGH